MTGSTCVLCKEEIPRTDSLFIDYEGHPAFEQRCSLCGWFMAEPPAITIMDGAVADGIHTREDIVAHFRKVIDLGTEPVLTTDAAQDYCHGAFKFTNHPPG